MASQPSLPQLLKSATEHFQRRSFAEAERVCVDVLRRFGEEANALMIMGVIRFSSGDTGGAIALLERARRKNPTHPHVLNNLGNAYRSANRLPEARAVLELAIANDGKFAAAYNNLGNVLLDMQLREDAQRYYQRALELQPDYSDAIANLARIAEETHQLEQAEAVASRAIQLVPGHHQARLTYARVLQRKGDVNAAVPLFEALLREGGLPQKLRVSAHGFLAECHERLKNHDAAFEQFTAANELQFHQYAQQFGDDAGFMSRRRIEQMVSFLERVPASRWTASPVCSQTPVFLVGFPRSGTTLLDQILSSHPDVTVLEERDTLVDICKVMMPSDGGIDFWADLAEHQIEPLRVLYWEQVHAGLRGLELRSTFVDKLPLNAALLPLIHRLFPTAKIILALRDPRDCVLSSFQQRFGMNRAMFQMLRLQSAAAYYDLIMTVVQTSRSKLPLDLHEVKYEEVIRNFDDQILQLLRFLGLSWSDSVRDYASTAKLRSINTPSATQVVQPLYQSSIGKWRFHQAHLSPILPVLAPWVAAFGYAD